ncbi:hypothetical protein D3C76_1771860 [compost metagenome]
MLLTWLVRLGGRFDHVETLNGVEQAGRGVIIRFQEEYIVFGRNQLEVVIINNLGVA